MSTELGLGDVLAQAQTRLAELSKETPVLRDEGEAHRTLRLIAVAYGHDADQVISSFNRGGALADLARAVLQVVPRASGPVGAPKRPETARAHEAVHALMRQGLSKGKAVAQVAQDEGVKPETIRGRLRRRKKEISGVVKTSDNPANST